ncbi:hypothetical protein ACFW88_31360 [Streptomyces anandii]|uniref:MFS transporter n=1 Tax=Streptomyces anandii TaxID=285454 RepID=A0ABW6HET3_9ACTN
MSSRAADKGVPTATLTTTVCGHGKRRGERGVVSNIVRGSIGSLIEWYDWYACTAFSVYYAAALPLR